MKKQKLKRRMWLCPVCRWEEDSTTGDTRFPSRRDSNEEVKVATSYTNMKDLRSYVLSNLRSFTGPGGCALLLETVLNIHGHSRVERMLRRARGNSTTSDRVNPLLSCSCVSPQKQPGTSTSFNGFSSAQRKKKSDDSIPPGHECISVELISLLLTGQVHTNLQNWSTGGFGIGILNADDKYAVGRDLLSPSKPVWLIRGYNCFSCLWVDNKNVKCDMKSLDQPGSAFELVHWNTWYGGQART
eukprot:8746406-Ditylum_brightwellii.AAC.1